MDVGRICSRRVTCLEANDTALGAAQAMRDEAVGAIVVVERSERKRVPLGVVTDRDLVVRILAVDPEHFTKMHLRELIPADVVTCREHDEVSDVLALMNRRGIRRIPVVDASGDLCGIVALDDVLRAIADDMARVGLLVTGQRVAEVCRNGG